MEENKMTNKKTKQINRAKIAVRLSAMEKELNSLNKEAFNYFVRTTYVDRGLSNDLPKEIDSRVNRLQNEYRRYRDMIPESERPSVPAIGRCCNKLAVFDNIPFYAYFVKSLR